MARHEHNVMSLRPRGYRYRALDANGNIVRGHIDAEDIDIAERQLRQRKLELIHATPVRWPWRRAARHRRLPRRELMHFCFCLEQLLAAGVPVLDALAEMGDMDSHSATAAICAALRAEIEQGQTLSAAAARFPKIFDEVFCCLLRAGETTGDLAPVLRQLAAGLARADELRAQAVKAAIYPMIVAAVLAVAIAIALTQVVPQLATLFQSTGNTLPLATRLLTGLAAWLGQYGWLLPPALIAIVMMTAFAAARHHGIRRALHAAELRLPLLGPIRLRLALARIASLISMLYASGITVTEAIASTARATSNLVIRHGIEHAGSHIASGSGIAQAFEATGLFPRLVTRMLRIGEQTGRLDTALDRLAHFYERDAREAIERLQASIEPLLTVFMGLILLWIVFAILGPVYDIITRLPL
jgi:type IV pilus assembly protein PilC